MVGTASVKERALNGMASERSGCDMKAEVIVPVNTAPEKNRLCESSLRVWQVQGVGFEGDENCDRHTGSLHVLATNLSSAIAATLRTFPHIQIHSVKMLATITHEIK